jgi:ATP-dependent RNA helicase MSS116, mitochondrial
MFTSDVSARGVDYPDVTLVMQVGLTEKEQYVHRIGRTARCGGLEGRGLLIANDLEEKWIKDILRGLPIKFVPFREPSKNDSIWPIFN